MKGGGMNVTCLPHREGGASVFKHQQSYKQGVYLEHFLNVEVQAHNAEDLSWGCSRKSPEGHFMGENPAKNHYAQLNQGEENEMVSRISV